MPETRFPGTVHISLQFMTSVPENESSFFARVTARRVFSFVKIATSIPQVTLPLRSRALVFRCALPRPAATDLRTGSSGCEFSRRSRRHLYRCSQRCWAQHEDHLRG